MRSRDRTGIEGRQGHVFRPVAAATPTLGDNQAMYRMVTQEGATSRTRYYERATMLIKRAVLMLLLQPYLVGTTT